MTNAFFVFDYTNGTVDFMARHFDYNSNSAISLSFENSNEFLGKINRINKTKEWAIS